MSERKLKTRAEVQAEAQARRAAKTAKARKRGVKKVNAKRGGHRFPDGVSEELRDFTRKSPCLIAGVNEHRCQLTRKTDLGTGDPYWGNDAAHVEPESRGTGDFDNLVSLCRTAHKLQEGRNKWFEATFGVNLKAAAKRTTARWIKETKAGL